ncbi:MAG: septal ring lytic transglycosylase RlpA family protein [Candidatus Binatus sp.]
MPLPYDATAVLLYWTGFNRVLRIRNYNALGRVALGLATSALFAACATSRPAQLPPAAPVAVPQPTPTPQVIGMASWYGPGFHGRHDATGGIYDQEDMTAASIAFPLGSRVMVTNLANGRSVEVTITDRGPFVKGRKIDLSHKAARMIGMLDRGTARVRVSLISKLPGTRAVGAPLRYWVQVGSFSEQRNAQQVRSRLASAYADVHVVDVLDADHHRYYRVRMGAFATRSAAGARASDSARFGLPVIIVTE